MVHAYVTSCLNIGNSLLYGISVHLIIRLQRVQEGCCPSDNQNEETRPRHCSSGRSSLASDQTTYQVQTATVDVSKPSRHSCSILNRPINSLPADPCATLCGRSPAGDSMMQATYTGRNKLLLHASGTICHLPCVPRTASVRSKSKWRR